MKSNNGDEVDSSNNNNRSSQFHHSSIRIIRASRASGGKDRHSKVCTSKGLRDRRVRLSATTAIQFYDLQDRLGYDRPSKVVDWLIKAAEYAISELPSLNNTNFRTDDVNPNQHQTVVKPPIGTVAATANLLSSPKNLQDAESNIGSSQSLLEYIEDDEMIGDVINSNNGDEVDNNNNWLSQFYHSSSRIIRASRASGGKDRHSKVCTSKGPRDRRVQLSVTTTIQFYHLQDRLGYDRPSKAVDWLIKAAKDPISELPSLNNTNFLTDDLNPNQKQTVLSYLPRSSKILQDSVSLPEPQDILVDDPSFYASDDFERLSTCVHFPPLKDYDVVIRCGRGVIRNNDFISHLRAALCRRGISVYEEFDEVNAVPESRVLIILLTSTYVPSNLLHILEHQQTEYQVVYPIFYRLSPYDLISNFKSYERIFLQDEPKRWQAALKEITQMPGYTLTDKSESELIDEIVRDVLKAICSGDNVNMIGMGTQVEEILSLLRIESLDVRSIGLWGTVGIGKTSIAEEIFRRISVQYETSVFLKDLHTEAGEHGHDAVREEFVSKVLDVDPNVIRISDIKTSFLRSRLQHKRVLIVLDDVNDYKDVEIVLGKLNYFGPGSRIIMTSRNRRVFVLCKLNHVYEVKPLDIPNSLLLLDRGTFQFGMSPEIYRTLSLDLVKFSNGNPQVLQFLSSTDREWNSLLKEIQKTYPMYIPDIFERIFCGLDDNERSIFLDIACFLRRMEKDNDAMFLDDCGFSAHVGFKSLVEKSLLTISHNMLDMPSFIQATGREMVRQESADRPGYRSRLWNTEDIRDVFINDSGTSVIEGIFLDMSKLKLDANPTIFQKMFNLRLLKFYCSKVMENHRVSLPQGLEYLPSKLRLLHWEYYPLKSLPQSFDPRNLIEFNLPSSSAEKLWKGKKNLEKLKKMRLSYSYQLTKLPRLSSASNLEHIDLEGCNSLLSISQSISHLRKLVHLNLKACSKLESIPSMVDLESLEVLNLSGCSKLENFPEISPNVRELYMSGTMIQEIPSSIKNLVLLEKLDLENSRHLKKLPTSISKLKHLETLNLSGCTSLDQFPDLSRKMKCLRVLDLSRTAIKELPSSISYLTALEELRFVGCRNLVRLPDNAWSLRFKVEFRQIDTEKFSRLWNKLGWLKKVKIS